MCLIFSYLIYVVNLKKDSENTPVKGGIMADLGRHACAIVNAYREVSKH